MRRAFRVFILTTMFLAGCSGWGVQPIPYPPPTFFPTPTPLIYSPTPVILAPPVTATLPSTPLISSLTPTQPGATLTFTPSPQSTFTGTPITSTATTPTLVMPSPTTNSGPTPLVSIRTDILGCNTSIDIMHGMGEVTNAYITISNTGTEELTNVCATLNAADEGRPHPDKTKCVASLPIGRQVTQKLTVDTTFKKSTSIQVETKSDLGLLQRVSQDSCANIGLFIPGNKDLGVIKPIPNP